MPIILYLGIPHDINFSVAKDTFLTVPGIVTVHNLRIWGLTTDKTALSAHLVIGKLQSHDLFNFHGYSIRMRSPMLSCPV